MQTTASAGTSPNAEAEGSIVQQYLRAGVQLFHDGKAAEAIAAFQKGLAEAEKAGTESTETMSDLYAKLVAVPKDWSGNYSDIIILSAEEHWMKGDAYFKELMAKHQLTIVDMLGIFKAIQEAGDKPEPFTTVRCSGEWGGWCWLSQPLGLRLRAQASGEDNQRYFHVTQSVHDRGSTLGGIHLFPQSQWPRPSSGKTSLA